MLQWIQKQTSVVTNNITKQHNSRNNTTTDNTKKKQKKQKHNRAQECYTESKNTINQKRNKTLKQQLRRIHIKTKSNNRKQQYYTKSKNTTHPMTLRQIQKCNKSNTQQQGETAKQLKPQQYQKHNKPQTQETQKRININKSDLQNNKPKAQKTTEKPPTL